MGLHSLGGWAGLHSREGGRGFSAERGEQAQQGGWVGLHSWRGCRAWEGGRGCRAWEGGWGCTAGRVGGAAQQGGKVGGVPPLLPRWPFPLPRLHPPLSMPSCPQIPSSTPTSSPYSIFLFADCDHWTGSLPRCNCMCVWRGTWVNLQ